MAATATTAGAAASLRPLLPALSALPSPTPLLRLPTNPKLTNLHLKTSILSSPLPITLLPLSSSSSSSAAAFTETDDEKEENQFQPTKSTPRPSRPDDAGRLYVGNLPYSLTAPQLSEVFSAAGSVISVEIVYDRVTDRSRGFAFVTMASADEATEAIRMFDGSQVGGRTVKVNFPEVPRGGEREVMGPRPRGSWRSRGYVDSPYKVYAGNLGWGVTSEALRDAFAGSSGVLGAKVIYELGTGRSRGYGFVSFASPEQARAAIEDMNGKELEGRPLRLNLASERPSVAADAAAAGASAEETSDSPSGLFQESLT